MQVIFEKDGKRKGWDLEDPTQIPFMLKDAGQEPNSNQPQTFDEAKEALLAAGWQDVTERVIEDAKQAQEAIEQARQAQALQAQKDAGFAEARRLNNILESGVAIENAEEIHAAWNVAKEVAMNGGTLPEKVEPIVKNEGGA